MASSKIIISILVFSLFANGWSQEQSYNLRSLNITVGDTLIKTKVLNEVPKKLKLIHAPYYWYYAGEIQVNYGGYSGKLLHGKFETFDKNSKLIQQGVFNYGLKQGSWIEWYPNGLKKKTIQYNNGYPDGEVLSFDIHGRLLSRKSYDKGKLDGKSFFYSPDTIIVKDYKKGKEIIKKKKAEKKKVQPKLKIKGEKAANDTVQSPKKPGRLFFNREKKQKAVKDEKV